MNLLKVLVLCLMSASVLAGPDDWYNWVGPLTIKNVRVQGDRNIVSFQTVEDHVNPNGKCNTGYYALSPEKMPKELFSVLLAAHASKKQISINIDGTKCEPYGRILVTQIRIL
jgi:hypothetical protein